MNLASNALLAKSAQSFLSPTRIAKALDRGGSTLRSKELPVCVEGSNSHCRSLKRQRAQRVPFTNFRSELSVQNHALFLFRALDTPRPVRKKTWATAPASVSSARRNALRAKKPLRRHSAAGGAAYPCPVPRKRRYLAIFTPSSHRQHPGGSLVGHGGHRAGRPGPPQVQNLQLRPLGLGWGLQARLALSPDARWAWTCKYTPYTRHTRGLMMRTTSSLRASLKYQGGATRTRGGRASSGPGGAAAGQCG
jgi:hypothetical protein